MGCSEEYREWKEQKRSLREVRPIRHHEIRDARTDPKPTTLVQAYHQVALLSEQEEYYCSN